VTWADVMRVFWAFQIARCLEGEDGSARYTADAKYLGKDNPDADADAGAGAASSHKRKREEPRPVVEDEACHAFFGRLRHVCEKTCEEVLGQPYAGFRVRLFFNGSQGIGQGPHTDGSCEIKGSVRMVCHLVPPDYEGVSGIKLYARKPGPGVYENEVVRKMSCGWVGGWGWGVGGGGWVWGWGRGGGGLKDIPPSFLHVWAASAICLADADACSSFHHCSCSTASWGS
jgi:hypothetical protein